MSGRKAERKERASKDIIPTYDVREIKEMKVEEAIKRGIMPFNPIEMAESTGEIIEMGQNMGYTYGSAVSSLISAFRRKDLPMNVRIAKASRGMLALLTMLISASDVVEAHLALEDSVVQRARVDETDKLIEEVERLRKRVDELEKENKELKEKAKGKNQQSK